MNKKRICLVTSGHPPFDERIFWKFGKSLRDAGYSVSIFCSTKEIDELVDGVDIKGFDGVNYSKNKKINELYNLINRFNPDLIICSEMLPVFAALKFRKLHEHTILILDITEWYPENVAFKFTCFKLWIKYLQLLLPYIYILHKVDHLIIGEVRKRNRYDFLISSKPKTIIGYYPVLKYFNYKAPDLTKQEIVLGYAGVITYERGILTLLKAALSIAIKYPHKKIKLLLFGKFTYQNEEDDFKQKISPLSNLEVEFVGWTDYDKMSSVIERMDLGLDLRERNFIYRNSLPIKIFEYMACGKPFIYSDINPIREELEYEKYGSLVNPEAEIEIVVAIENYLNSPELAIQQSLNARELIEEEKNWENESRKLVELINKLLA